jgi:hypothetical protein
MLEFSPVALVHKVNQRIITTSDITENKEKKDVSADIKLAGEETIRLPMSTLLMLLALINVIQLFILLYIAMK